MGLSVAQTYLADILHVISQALLIPVIVLLIGFIAYALYCIGSVISEYFNERRHFKVVMPKFLAALMEAKQEEIPSVIEESGLLNRQKQALLTVYEYRTLPGDALVALIKRLVDEEESRYDRIRARNNMAARISPMVGLMGTLIPLGPGIEALGRADTAALSSSLLVAFDTTVAGLIVAAICLAVGKIRGNWYEDYLSALDAGMATMLEKIEGMRSSGEITTEEPSDYSFLFGREAATVAGKTPSTSSVKPSDNVSVGARGQADELPDGIMPSGMPLMIDPPDLRLGSSSAPDSPHTPDLDAPLPSVETPEVEATEPEIIEPQVTESEVIEPEAIEVEVAEVEATTPGVIESEVTKVEVAEPEATTVEVAEPELPAIEMVEVEAAEPEVAEPEAIEPEVTEVEVADPEVIEPEITAVEVPEPEAVVVEMAEPEVTDAAESPATAEAESNRGSIHFEPPRRPWE